MSPELKVSINLLVTMLDKVAKHIPKEKAIAKLRKQPKKKAKKNKWGIFKYCKYCKRQYDGKHYIHECYLKGGRWFRREHLKSQYLKTVAVDWSVNMNELPIPNDMDYVEVIDPKAFDKGIGSIRNKRLACEQRAKKQRPINEDKRKWFKKKQLYKSLGIKPAWQ